MTRLVTRSNPAQISRRSLLQGGSLAAGVAAISGIERVALAHQPLFTLGVASGDPDEHSVTLWTRLAPSPLQDGGGMPGRVVPVSYQVAIDPQMRRVVRSGFVLARPESAHTVHVRPEGLDSNRWYYYRFSCLGQESRIGRTRTFPSPFDRVHSMRFALASCQDYQAGFYAAYRHMAEQNLDFVMHVGDYIYEYGTDTAGVRQVPDGETKDLAGYRRRYALYRLDPHLQETHARFPFVVTFDDHEVENNYAGALSEDGAPEDEFLARRAAAYQAYFEHMPLSEPNIPEGPDVQLYRSLSFGRLADLLVLDTRQYRTDQPCGDGLQPACPAVFDPEATLLGESQERWLRRRLTRSRAQWKVLGQQIMMMPWDLKSAVGAPVPVFNMDAWDGYAGARARLLGFLAQARIQNAIVLTGDIHSAWQGDLRADPTESSSPIVATEFVGTSITSVFPPNYIPLVQATLPSNPHIGYFDGAHRGYMIHEVTRESWRAAYLGVRDVADANSEVDVLARFTVRDGEPGGLAE